jgi:transcriptional regulator with XRE-family HTH domain
MDRREEIKDFLTSRRARLTPEQAGLRFVDVDRRVPGLRREEVAMLAGISIDYYVRFERGNLSGASDSVLNALGLALQLDDDERAYLLDLARTTTRSSPPASGIEGSDASPEVTDSIQLVLDSLSVPAIVLNRRLDILAANALGRALHSGAYAMARSAGRTPNLARYSFLAADAATFYVHHDEAKDLTVALLRSATGHDPLDRELTALIGELSTYSPDFAQRWARHDVSRHTSGHKVFNHPTAGRLELDFNDFTPPGAPHLMLTTYTATPGSRTAANLAALAC